jgi:lysophospholipase L1-like esterase
LAGLLAFALAPAAAAKGRDAGVRVGKVALTPAVEGRSTLLVPVSYPIAFAGRPLELSLRVFPRGQAKPIFRVLHTRASAGVPRVPERRRRFTFVHAALLGRALTRDLEDGGRAVVKATGTVDANHDGVDELSLPASAPRELSPAAASEPLCATVAQFRILPARRLTIKLPACTSSVRWQVTQAPRDGKARILGDTLVYHAPAGFRGTVSLRLTGGAPVVIKVGTAQRAVVRAMGDSVTAGFGYYDDGSPMGLLSLPECKPGSVTLVDACSSNSQTTSNDAEKVEYAPDYGLANNVSWAAQWANEHGMIDYENLAISGSEPINWAPEGSLYETTERIESEDPDYILMTLGANPLLANMLFGVDNMGCAIYADLFGRYDECIERSFAEVKLQKYLKSLYKDLVAKTDATIYLMQYHLAIPSTALAYTSFQIAEMGRLMNREIASVAAEVNPKRLQVVAPLHFNVGIDISPVYPSGYSCSRFGYKVDGPSVQIDATQDELLAAHPLSFCEGPASGPPWVISGDTGIHPSATGYTQMASQVPAPE